MKPLARLRIVLLAGTVMIAGCSLSPERSPQPALHDFGPATEPGAKAPIGWSTVTVVLVLFVSRKRTSGALVTTGNVVNWSGIWPEPWLPRTIEGGV